MIRLHASHARTHAHTNTRSHVYHMYRRACIHISALAWTKSPARPAARAWAYILRARAGPGLKTI